MRSMLSLLVLCLLAASPAVVRAKIVSYSGQVTLVDSSLPPNTWSYRLNSFSYEPTLEVPSPSINGVLGLGVFDEQQGVVLTAAQANSFVLADGSHLTPGVPYDAFYVWGHQTYALGGSASYSASGTVTTDNKVLACTSSNGADDDGTNEIASDPYFALPGIYYQNVTQGARGFEVGDTGVPFGTTFTFTNFWSEPGDYTRCFSVTCGTCTCTTTAALTNSAYCLDSTKGATVTLQISDLTTTFSSSCSYVSSSSFYAQFVGAGASSDGQSITVSTASSTAVSVLLTAGCGCANNVVIPLPSCNPCGNDCPVANRQGCNYASTASDGLCVGMSFSAPPSGGDSCTSTD